MSHTSCKLIWLKKFLQEMGSKVETPMKLFCENQAAIHLVTNPVYP
jgi:hypothetical protein